MLSGKSCLSIAAVLLPVGLCTFRFFSMYGEHAVGHPQDSSQEVIFSASAETRPGSGFESGYVNSTEVHTEIVHGSRGTRSVSDSITELSIREQSRGATPVSIPARPESSSVTAESPVEAFTEPYREVAVAASEMGILTEMRVREGDTVRQGDIIALMDVEVLRASQEVARRSMTAEGALNSARADLEMKLSERAKLHELRSRNHASQQEVDRIDTEIRIAEARLQSVREELEIKQLEFLRIEAQLNQRTVRSPMNGIVTDVTREAGEYVSPSDPTVARVVQLDPLLIVFSVPLSQRNQISREQTVTLKVGSDAVRVPGFVEYVSPTSDSSNSSVRVKVRLPNPDGRFHSGERTVLIIDSLDPIPTPPESTGASASAELSLSGTPPVSRTPVARNTP